VDALARFVLVVSGTGPAARDATVGDLVGAWIEFAKADLSPSTVGATRSPSAATSRPRSAVCPSRTASARAARPALRPAPSWSGPSQAPTGDGDNPARPRHSAKSPPAGRLVGLRTSAGSGAQDTSVLVIATSTVVESSGYRASHAPVVALSVLVAQNHWNGGALMAHLFRTMAFSLDTERLSLRLRTEADADCNLTLLREHEGGTTLSLRDVEQRMVEQNRRAHVDGFGLLGIRRRDEDSPIGYCGLIVGRASLEEPELAYEILSQFRGRGYASEAAGAVIQAAFATGRERLWATVATANAPSLRVLEKHGFHVHHRSSDERGGEVCWLERTAPT
jgi:RimJ/RimL family protein N-acetyltransferase